MTSKSTTGDSYEYDFLPNPDDRPHSKKFRFKSRPELSRDEPDSANLNRTSSSSRWHSSSQHRRKRRKVSTPIDDPSTYDDSVPNLPPEAAFRESLFDALGDDEGAAFWEGVYGQPIHSYSNKYVDQETGELEQMTDDEYAQHVRRKMWERSWEGIEAEKQERRRKEQEQADRKHEDEDQANACRKKDFNAGRIFDFEVEESLKRGQQRRQQRRWKTLWETYIKRWEDSQNSQNSLRTKSVDTSDAQQVYPLNEIAWPVESGNRSDVEPAEIERFVLNGVKSTEQTLLAALKVERVRWHPDKIQQRYGHLGIDEKSMKGATAVFQVIDRLWNERREKE